MNEPLNPLAVPPVHIQTQRNADGTRTFQTTEPDTHADKILARVGVFLQRMLKREYGDTDEMLDDPKIQDIMKVRNPRLAHLDPVTALETLKSELRAFAERREPFERPLRPGQTIRDWWIKVQKDQFAHILGVSTFICVILCCAVLTMSRL